MTRSLLVALCLVLASPSARADDDSDVDFDAQTSIAAAGKRIGEIDAEAAKTSAERKTTLAKERRQQVTKIVDAGSANPKSPTVNLAAGRALADANEPASAKPFADKAVELAPRNPEPRVVRGNVNFALGNYPAAAEDAKSALRLDPKHEGAKALLKFAESRLADMTGRVKLPPKSAFTQPSAPEPEPDKAALTAAAGPAPILGRDALVAQRVKASESLQEGRNRLRLGDHPGASRLAQKASLQAPEDAEILAQAAFMRFKAGDPAGATQDAEKAAALEPKADNFLLLAVLHDALGQGALTQARLERAGQLSPRYANLARKAAGLAPADFTSFLNAELSAKFTPDYDAALAKLGDDPPAGPAQAFGPPGAASSLPAASGLRWALAAIGALLLIAMLWGLVDRGRARE